MSTVHLIRGEQLGHNNNCLKEVIEMIGVLFSASVQEDWPVEKYNVYTRAKYQEQGVLRKEIINGRNMF
jgi:hypothetical protein